MESGSTPDAWTWADAWILASMSGERGGMTLSELIGSADAHNHAIPTRDELASALGGLLGAGLIETTERGFRTTDQGKSLKKHWKGGMFGWSTSLLSHLEKLSRAADEYPLTDAEVDEAYTAYVRRV